MIFIFGDSWARHSAVHVSDEDKNLQTSSIAGIPVKNISRYGYRHWAFPDIFVEFNTNDWFNSHFKKNSVINFGEGGNTNTWIIENLHTKIAGVSNIAEPITVIVYQTDPLRIFAPRKDYTDQSVVWPAFAEWCNSNQFDYHTNSLTDLIDKIFNDFYTQLVGFKEHATSEYNLDIDLQLVGGVSAVHPVCKQHNIPVLINSVSEFFGYNNDGVMENQGALHRFIGFWCKQVSPEQRHRLLADWNHYDSAVAKKEKFWSQNPEHFAGRHLTSTAMAKLAKYIESKIV